ncbi:MAG: hypothetical protein A2068_04560 [Ignavibacteria bacterium GWB2_35_6b]|nr:MAG: hypothetical protein A2068_04560 [Ignavibacteria bacterium GWB2_35_6b]
MITKCPPSKTGNGRILIIAKLKLNIARKNKNEIIPLSADCAAYFAILTGPPKAFLNSISPLITLPMLVTVNIV